MQINKTVLTNGLTIITGELPGLQSAAVGAFVFAGAQSETAETNGIAHFLEHMAFKGTTSRSAHSIAVEVERHGSMLNAYTDYPLTAYYAVGLGAAVAEHVGLIADVLTHSLYDPADIALESSVVVQEIKQYEDDPGAVANAGFRRTAYPEQAFGRPILGTEETVRSFTQTDFRDFVGAHYTTGNVVVVAAGAVHHASFVELCTTAFTDLPAGATTLPAPAVYRGGFSLMPSSRFEQVTMMLGWPSVPATDPDRYAYELLGSALGGGMSSPLFQEVREKRGLVYAVHAQSAHTRDSGLFLISAGTTPENLETTLHVACQQLLRMTETIDPIDLERARNGYLVRLATIRERPFGLAGHLALSQHLFGDPVRPETIAEQVRAVTLDDLKAAARKLVKARPTVALAGPLEDKDYLDIVEYELV